MGKKEEMRRLDVKLTEEAKLEYGKEQAKLLVEVSELEGKRRVINAQIKPKNERIDHLAIAIDTGIEEQEVMCTWEYFWDDGLKTLTRNDTGEVVVDSETIPDWERQQYLRGV